MIYKYFLAFTIFSFVIHISGYSQTTSNEVKPETPIYLEFKNQAIMPFVRTFIKDNPELFNSKYRPNVSYNGSLYLMSAINRLELGMGIKYGYYSFTDTVVGLMQEPYNTLFYNHDCEFQTLGGGFIIRYLQPVGDKVDLFAQINPELQATFNYNTNFSIFVLNGRKRNPIMFPINFAVGSNVRLTPRSSLIFSAGYSQFLNPINEIVSPHDPSVFRSTIRLLDFSFGYRVKLY